MTKPMFVETSVGYVDLALVTQITKVEDKLRFVFIGSTSVGDGEATISPDFVEIPWSEGRAIIDLLKAVYPDGFVG